MENIVKKLEEQIAFLQHETLQMSDELYSQQKDLSALKKLIFNLEKRINDFENNPETIMVKKDEKPPHY
tara:strand:- start:72 stop:278 length:207 start_codon:yes stop_codon:yes gene_type:complete